MPQDCKRSCLFSSATARWKKTKDSFSSDWAEKLAESDKGSYFGQEQWLKKLNEQPSAECDSSLSSSTCSASRSKITVEESLADLESTETWQTFYGHAIVAGPRLQEKINESVTCRFCQESVELVENLESKNGPASIGCFSARTKAVRRTKLIFYFRRWKKSRALAINCASVLGFRVIDGGHATVSKVLSFLGLSPINRKCSVFPPRPA